MKKYDVAIALRMYPGISKQPIGNFENKLSMCRVNVQSLKESLGSLQAMFYVILDGCDDEYVSMLMENINEEDLIIDRRKGIGNAATFLLQIEWLLGQSFSERIFFAEDDYVYRPGKFAAMIALLENNKLPVHFVSPHNHGDYYQHPIHTTLGTKVGYLNNVHCHFPISTCLTFLTNKQVLSATRKVFDSYARDNYDFVIFAVLTRPLIFLQPKLSLLKHRHFVKSLLKAFRFNFIQMISGRRYRLAVAIDPVGTHLQYDEVGPGFDWDLHIQQLLKTS